MGPGSRCHHGRQHVDVVRVTVAAPMVVDELPRKQRSPIGPVLHAWCHNDGARALSLLNHLAHRNMRQVYVLIHCPDVGVLLRPLRPERLPVLPEQLQFPRRSFNCTTWEFLLKGQKDIMTAFGGVVQIVLEDRAGFGRQTHAHGEEQQHAILGCRLRHSVIDRHVASKLDVQTHVPLVQLVAFGVVQESGRRGLGNSLQRAGALRFASCGVHLRIPPPAQRVPVLDVGR
mmetsp:Transcript_79275/g.183973  ORF Transcript_79275/g.183973 Transcript_79275/m.183973 type:complete len:230 (+) Transcript_79275:375-1064(+)